MSGFVRTGYGLVRVALCVALCLTLCGAVLAGCARPPAEVTSAWPMAESERVVPRPPAPPRWPYTGAAAPSHEALARRPLSVKVENSPQARPQLGIGAADVVYETITEGGITRFNCIFHSKIPATVGPVRSARLSDLWVVPQYDGLFFFSGASSSVNARVRRAGIPDLSEDAGVSRPYWRSRERAAPHDLMLDTKKAYAEAKARGLAATASLEPLAFDRRSLEPTPAVGRIDIPFSQASSVSWVWDGGRRVYLRSNNGRAHVDAGTGRQVGVDNVVVMWAKYRPVSRDKVGSTTYDIELGGRGRVSVFRDGTRIDGEWRAGPDAPPTLRTATGALIRLKSGRTWFEVIPLDGRIIMR